HLRGLLAGAAVVLLLPLLTSSAQPRFEHVIATDSSDAHRPLSQALMDLAAETGADLLYDPSLVANVYVRTPELDGDLGERLAHLLVGTALTSSRLESGTYVLVPRRQRPIVTGAIRGRVIDVHTGRS